jgi:hypothetical protein
MSHGTTAALYLLRRDGYTPQFDAARAVAAITAADSCTALELAWLSIALDYEMSGRVVESVIGAAYEWQLVLLRAGV